jgi:CRP-like cAMP-binding protein
MNTEQIALLQNIAVFGGISADAVEFLLQRSDQCHVTAGNHFFEENDEALSMFVLEDGAVSVIRYWKDTPVILRHLGSGDCFGEIALMEMMPRSATVRADVDCTAIELPRAALFELYHADLEQFTLIQMNMGREICRRLHDADDRLFAEHQKNA